MNLTIRQYILLAPLVIAAVAVLYALYRSKPAPPMRTASQRQIERETAAIQRRLNWRGWVTETAHFIGLAALWLLAFASGGFVVSQTVSFFLRHQPI